MGLSGLAQLNIETNSTCDKRTKCSFCGHQDALVNTAIQYGEMDYALLETIRAQVEPGIIVSWHRDGDPLAYSRIGDALRLFSGFTTSIVTHGLNLERLADDLIETCSTITVSIFRGDIDGEMQRAALENFLRIKGDRSPIVQIKIVGDMSADELAPYEALNVRIIRRLIHVPISNSKYAHRSPTIPEGGVCLDALHRPTVDWRGRVSLCNRLDPAGHLFIGDVNHDTLDAIWNGETRRRMLDAHKLGRRDLANPLCKTCDYWGVASA